MSDLTPAISLLFAITPYITPAQILLFIFPSQTAETQTNGRLEVVSLYKGNQHYESTSVLLRFTLVLTTSGAEVLRGGEWAVTAGEKHYTGLGTAEPTSWELLKGRHRHYTIKSTIHSDRKEMQSGTSH